MAACAKCGKAVENEAFSGVFCQSCFEAEQSADAAARGGFLSKVPLSIAVAIVPFFVKFGSSSTSSTMVNGQVVAQSSHSINYVAIALGPLAIVLGIAAIVSARKGPAETRLRTFILSGVGILLGALQLVRGFS